MRWTLATTRRSDRRTSQDLTPSKLPNGSNFVAKDHFFKIIYDRGRFFAFDVPPWAPFVRFADGFFAVDLNNHTTLRPKNLNRNPRPCLIPEPSTFYQVSRWILCVGPWQPHDAPTDALHDAQRGRHRPSHYRVSFSSIFAASLEQFI